MRLEDWLEYAKHIEAGTSAVGGGRKNRRNPDSGIRRGVGRDVSVWTGAAEGTARDLEAFGHAAPSRVPPRDLAGLVRRGLNA